MLRARSLVSHVAALGLGAVLLGVVSGCVLLDRAEARYSTGTATIDEFTWVRGSPPPDDVPTGEFTLIEGAYDPDSSQETFRGAHAVFESDAGWRISFDRFDGRPRYGDVSFDPPEWNTAWSSMASASCVTTYAEPDLTVAFEGTIACKWAPVWVAGSNEELRADFVMTFSARP